MGENEIYVIKDKYIIKKSHNDILKAEKIFIDYNKHIKTQKIVDYDEKRNYTVYKYIKGNIIHNLSDVDNCLEYIYKLICMYKEVNIRGYGDIFNLQEKWTDFLKSEIDRQSKYINNDVLKKKVMKKVNILDKYSFKKKLIHGDLGGFNIIYRKHKIKGIIDPRCIVGDPIYDFIYFILSDFNISKQIELEKIFNILKNEAEEKIFAMLYILLYDRIAREQKNNTKRKNEFYSIWQKIEKIDPH